MTRALKRPRFVHEATRELFAYWDLRRGTRPAPDRSEIEPADIKHVLPDTFILEADPEAGFHWRLAGTRVCALHCRELRGRNFLADWRGRDEATLLALLQSVIRESAVAIVGFEGRTDSGQTLDLEMVLMPLKVFGRPTCRILGAVGMAERPYWIGISPPVRRTLNGVRMIWPSADKSALADEPPPPGVAPEGVEAVRRYGHLMVVEGGRARDFTPSQPRSR
jgi:hypothetical protein